MYKSSVKNCVICGESREVWCKFKCRSHDVCSSCFSKQIEYKNINLVCCICREPINKSSLSSNELALYNEKRSIKDTKLWGEINGLLDLVHNNSFGCDCNNSINVFPGFAVDMLCQDNSSSDYLINMINSEVTNTVENNKKYRRLA